ncbi:uncharacterized membrane protein YhaH (DUF805 family) [Wenyingzhuangia heitensis]|uniref:Uncharacterized membrane protein YhaH (DUF805 family) n=1 Tax=Wenyingzhuangia heitensis TaxID=1487859 RepID=A0ABX0U5S8_9FLAO|nr:DUF805 domain-containing protein [Wenyingzhuangia heitensis]NIJ44203.1 uncharacterized membrane protein YhaH (DUF805 family) [Wenyingzhuangia heitensis]
MDWYLKVLKQYADFNGRARRKEYWMFFLFNILISWGLQGIALTTGNSIIGYIATMYGLAVLLPGIGVSIRRLHDVNKSGWFMFIALIPLVGMIWLIVVLAKEGDKGPNQYGVDPKNPTDELDDIGVAQV